MRKDYPCANNARTPVKNIGWHRARHPGTHQKRWGLSVKRSAFAGELRDKPAEPVGVEAMPCARRGCFLHVHTVTFKVGVSSSSSAGLQ